MIRRNLPAPARVGANGRGIAHLPVSLVNPATLKRWIGVALVVAAILATALSWSGLSLGDLVSAWSAR
jgi:hypothetical protein